MTFFNKKEDVLSIELTPHGRKLLGQGNFKPVYYTFLDDDILYDSEKAGFSESSTSAKDRILNETVYMKPQTNYKGVETSINTKKPLSENIIDDNLIPERSEKLQYQLGTNNYNTNKSAEINSTFLLGEISGAVATQYTGSGIAPLDIPQINCDIEYVLSVEHKNEPKINKYGKLPEDFNFTDFKPDDSYIHIEKGEILLLLSEEGGFPEKENFSIEVFEYDEDGISLMPLKFDPKSPNIVDGILLENSELSTPFEESETTAENKAEFHMEILIDGEIPEDKLCLGTALLKQNNIYIDLEVNCEDTQSGFEVDLYQTTVTDDDLEDC